MSYEDWKELVKTLIVVDGKFYIPVEVLRRSDEL